MNILPMPKKIKENEGYLQYKTIKLVSELNDERLLKALSRLPQSDNGAILEINVEETEKETYSLDIEIDRIKIVAQSSAGAFYAIQTLRQILKHDEVSCCHIEDYPDFETRGVYHDITRGKVPTLETLKNFVDELAYYKINSLQLYVEQCFPFEEYLDGLKPEESITADEIKELDKHCIENFIELVPSLATFGHLYELLQKDKYKHLCEIENYEPDQVTWIERMKHHTIDPLNPESFEIIKSLLDQFIPLFSSDKFNICCDETFDLKNGKHKDLDTGKLYVDFVGKIIRYLKSKGKTVMMWGDVLNEHPEYINHIDDDVILLNWDYGSEPNKENIKQLSELKYNQIVCPGTWSWYALCENLEKSVPNITKMIEYGYEYNASGVLNTNWGDYGNPCSIELAMCGISLGAEKSWNAKMDLNDFLGKIEEVVYAEKGALKFLKQLSELQNKISWRQFVICYSNKLYKTNYENDIPDKDTILKVQEECKILVEELEKQQWAKDEYRLEMIVAAEGIAVMAELFAKHLDLDIQRYTDTEGWIRKYSKQWLKKNKESELPKIIDMFRYMDVIQ